LNEAFFVEIQF